MLKKTGKYLLVTTFLLFLGNSNSAQSRVDNPKLIVRIDDMGSFHSANRACIDSYKNGIATTVELMVPCPWFLEAVEMLKQNPELDVGVHLTLTSEWKNYKWGSLTYAPTLVDSNGYFFQKQKDWVNENAKDAFWNAHPDLKEVESELRAQLELAIHHLPNISHFSGHMGIGSSGVDPKMEELFSKLAEDYNLDIQLSNYNVEGLSGAMAGEQANFKVRKQNFIKTLKNLENGKTYLFVEHPGYDDPEMKAVNYFDGQNVGIDRDVVTKILTDGDVKKVIEERNIELINYSELKGR